MGMSKPSLKGARRWLQFFRAYLPLIIFKTPVGIKYKFSYFRSEQLSRYIEDEFAFTEAELTFADLLLSPDLLKNDYTLCGQAITTSPHYRLMEEIGAGTLTLKSDYAQRQQTGTLDARQPHPADLTNLSQKYAAQKEKLIQNGIINICAVPVNLHKTQYVILDGKHRAALVAQLHQPHALRISRLSKAFVREAFFHQLYAYTLRQTPSVYSSNQNLIRAIYNES